MHLQQHVHVIVFVMDERVPELPVIIPAHDVAALAGCGVEAYAVVADLCREEVESLAVGAQLLQYVAGQPDVPAQQVRGVLLQIGCRVQRNVVFLDRGKVVLRGNDVRRLPLDIAEAYSSGVM